MATQTHRTIDAVWRIESARLIAGLTRIVCDVGVAEDLAQDALVAALEKWPTAAGHRRPEPHSHGAASKRYPSMAPAFRRKSASRLQGPGPAAEM